ncbi:MAG TPA: hypothetical protein VMF89_14235, partial [Polyangiales bacterium]|nr:hypothetical protein [Polyangiales bacterium]
FPSAAMRFSKHASNFIGVAADDLSIRMRIGEPLHSHGNGLIIEVTNETQNGDVARTLSTQNWTRHHLPTLRGRGDQQGREARPEHAESLGLAAFPLRRGEAAGMTRIRRSAAGGALCSDAQSPREGVLELFFQ